MSGPRQQKPLMSRNYYGVGKSRLVEEFLRQSGIRHLCFQAPRLGVSPRRR